MQTPNSHSSPTDLADNPEYQLWVKRMAGMCRCARDRPCDGILAGGLCDDVQEREEERSDDDE